MYLTLYSCNSISSFRVSEEKHSVQMFKVFFCPLVVKARNALTAVFDPQAEEERDGMEKVKLDNRRILFNLLPAHVAQHFLLSNPRNMVRL